MKKIFFSNQSLYDQFDDFNLSNKWLLSNYKDVMDKGRFIGTDEFVQMANDGLDEVSVWNLDPIEMNFIEWLGTTNRVLIFSTNNPDLVFLFETPFKIWGIDMDATDDNNVPLIVLYGENEVAKIKRTDFFEIQDNLDSTFVGENYFINKVVKKSIVDYIKKDIEDMLDEMNLDTLGYAILEGISHEVIDANHTRIIGELVGDENYEKIVL